LAIIAGMIVRIAALSLIALFRVLPAQALTCPASEPAVSIALSVAEPALDNSLPQPALQELAGAYHHGGRTQGLYRAEIGARWHLAIGRRDGGGETCRWIKQVKIELRLDQRTIYIVRQRPPGTCAYDSVLAHERKHQATDEALLAAHRPRIAAAAQSAIRALPTAAAVPRDAGAAEEARLLGVVSAAVKRGLAALNEERRVRQQAIDTPEEYRRVRAACG
jgi:hypothetical protein